MYSIEINLFFSDISNNNYYGDALFSSVAGSPFKILYVRDPVRIYITKKCNVCQKLILTIPWYSLLPVHT